MMLFGNGMEGADELSRSCEFHTSWESQGYWRSNGSGSQPHQDESGGNHGLISTHHKHNSYLLTRL
jgi:hypothetical protein